MSDSKVERAAYALVTEPVEAAANPQASPEALGAENARLVAENARLRAMLPDAGGADTSEARRTEETRRRFELMARQSRDIVLVLRQDDGGILEANEAATAAYGYEHDELLALTIHDLRSPDRSSWTAAQLAEADARGILFETVHRRKDGSTFPVEVSSRGATLGNTPTLMSVIRDITERKRAEEALRQSEARYRALFENSIDAIFLTSSDGRVLGANRAACTTFGMTEQGIIAAGREGVADWSDSRHDPALAQRASSGEIRCELGYRRKDGSKFVAEVSSVILPDGATSFVILRDITERKRTEDQLRELSQRLTYHVDNSPLAVIEWGPDMRLARWSGEAERIFGWKAEEVLGKRMEDFRWIYHEDEAQVAEVSATCSRARTRAAFSANRNYRKDGSVVQCEWYNSSLLDESGKLRSILSLVLDVTERKRAEEALRESEERLRVIVENTPDHILVQDHELRYEAVINPQLGLTEEGMLGKTDAEILSGADADNVTKVKRQVIETGQTVTASVALQNRQGQQEFFEGAYVPRRDAAGRINGLIGYFRNVSERKRAEEALRQSEERFRLALKHAPVAVAAQNRDLRFLWAYNQRTVNSAEVVGKLDTDLFAPEDAARLMALKRRVMESGKEEREQLWLTSNGRRVFLDLCLEPTRDANGQVTGVGMATVDLTAMKEAEEALRDADQRKDGFLAMLSHELRNPFAPISNSLFILDRAVPGGEQANRAKVVIARQVGQLTRLVDDLLDVTRITRGKFRLQRARFDLVQMVSRTAEDLQADVRGC